MAGTETRGHLVDRGCEGLWGSSLAQMGVRRERGRTSQFSSLTGFRSPGGAQRAACWSSAEQRRGVQTSRRGSMNLLVSHSSHTERDKGGIRAMCVVVLHQPDLDFATCPQQVQSGSRIPYTGTRTCLGVRCLMLLDCAPCSQAV